ncbi:uncharacterized protein [Haliotis asinina]|uniref:uncharacterized protein n=1 Tax=Haliotis asinina TaxID=109174 RepID=UPI003531B3F3
MNSPWLIQILLLLVTSRCDSRPSPRGCGRKFHIDFERGHPSEYEGGIWQGLEGRVTFRRGKAWLDGHGSLIYPFFSHNDLRSGFAFSFKIKPAKIAPGGRVAIITNGRDAGSSTLTVFHNGTCLGVKVVEIAETWNAGEGMDFSRNVELTVDYTKQMQRLKRSSDTSTTADIYIDSVQVDDDMNNGETKNDATGPFETSDKGPRFSSGEHSGNYGDVAGVPDDGAREDHRALTTNYDIIAVRKLYREDTTDTHSSVYHVDNDVKNTTITTTYSDIADTSFTTPYKITTVLPSPLTHIVITGTTSTTTHSDITDVQSTTMYTPPKTTHAETTERASSSTYNDIADTSSTTMITDSTETASTMTYTPSTTAYSEDTETIEQSYTDNKSTNSDSESDTNSATPQGGFPSSTVSDHTDTTLIDSSPDINVGEQTTSTPQSTTDFVVHRQPSTHSVHTDTLTEQTAAVGHVSTHVSSGVSLQQTTMLPTTTSRGPKEKMTVPRRNRFLIIPNIFRGLQEEDPDEIEVRLAQDNGVLQLQVGESAIQETTVGVTEHMKAPRSPLRVGAGDGLLPYRGSFDEFSMYDCAPLRFFNDEN